MQGTDGAGRRLGRQGTRQERSTGVAAAAGITAGVLAERSTHASHEAEKAQISRDSSAWLGKANKHFAADAHADRLRNRELDGKIEDYVLANPGPSSVTWGRDGAGFHEYVEMPDRENFFMGTIMGGAFGGLIGAAAIRATLGTARTVAGRTGGAAAGTALVGLSVGTAVGVIASNWTH